MNEPPESKPMEACTRLTLPQLMASIRTAKRNASPEAETFVVTINKTELLELHRDIGPDGWTVAHPVLLMP